MRYFVILSLLAIVMPLIVFTGTATAGVANATATPEPTNYTIPSFESFFACIFGVHIFPGADPVGAYTVNDNPNYVSAGTISGTMMGSYDNEPMSDVVIYLGEEDGTLLGSYITTTDENGYYAFDDLPLGQYYVYFTKSIHYAQIGDGMQGGFADLTPSAPNAVVNLTLDPK